MKYFFALLFTGGVVCVLNICIMQFLKGRISQKNEPWKEEDFKSVHEDLDRELQGFKEVLEGTADTVRGEIARLETEKEELKALLEESRACIEEMKKMQQENVPAQCRPGAASEGQGRDPRWKEMHALLDQGLSLHSVAQRMEMGMGEARLRLALSEKGEMVREDRR